MLRKCLLNFNSTNERTRRNLNEIPKIPKEELIIDAYRDILPDPDKDYSKKIDNYTLEYQNRIDRVNKNCQDHPDHPNLLDEYKNLTFSSVKLNPDNEPRFMTSRSSDSKITYCSLTKCGSSNWRTTIRDIEMIKSGKMSGKNFSKIKMAKLSGNRNFTSRKDMPGYRFRREHREER